MCNLFNTVSSFLVLEKDNSLSGSFGRILWNLLDIKTVSFNSFCHIWLIHIWQLKVLDPKRAWDRLSPRKNCTTKFRNRRVCQAIRVALQERKPFWGHFRPAKSLITSSPLIWSQRSDAIDSPVRREGSKSFLFFFRSKLYFYPTKSTNIGILQTRIRRDKKKKSWTGCEEGNETWGWWRATMRTAQLTINPFPASWAWNPRQSKHSLLACWTSCEPFLSVKRDWELTKKTKKKKKKKERKKRRKRNPPSRALSMRMK